MKQKQILKYALVFFAGFFVGVCVMFETAYELTKFAEHRIWLKNQYTNNLKMSNDSTVYLLVESAVNNCKSTY